MGLREIKMEEAITRLAALIENGELIADTDPASFLDIVAKKIIQLTERVKETEKRLAVYETCQTCGCEMEPWKPDTRCETCSSRDS